MADNNVYSPIPARLHSVATEGVVSGADEIFDDAKGKRQSVINQETDAALDNKYDKDETYSKEELNNLITTPNQDYVTVPTYASLPATGEADTVYRVSNYDGEQSQVDATKYSEYAWDGTQYVFLCVKTQIGEVFDITAYNSNTKYADLTAALGTGGANIPEGLRKGGMSVKFVLTYDNKYIQARLMSDSFNTNIANWQVSDFSPIANSKNLAESGGVALVEGAFIIDKTITANPTGATNIASYQVDRAPIEITIDVLSNTATYAESLWLGIEVKKDGAASHFNNLTEKDGKFYFKETNANYYDSTEFIIYVRKPTASGNLKLRVNTNNGKATIADITVATLSINANRYNNKTDNYSDVRTARLAVPVKYRSVGQIISYRLNGSWIIEQFVGSLYNEIAWIDEDGTRWTRLIKKDSLDALEEKLEDDIERAAEDITNFLPKSSEWEQQVGGIYEPKIQTESVGSLLHNGTVGSSTYFNSLVTDVIPINKNLTYKLKTCIRNMFDGVAYYSNLNGTGYIGNDVFHKDNNTPEVVEAVLTIPSNAKSMRFATFKRATAYEVYTKSIDGLTDAASDKDLQDISKSVDAIKQALPGDNTWQKQEGGVYALQNFTQNNGSRLDNGKVEEASSSHSLITDFIPIQSGVKYKLKTAVRNLFNGLAYYYQQDTGTYIGHDVFSSSSSSNEVIEAVLNIPADANYMRFGTANDDTAYEVYSLVENNEFHDVASKQYVDDKIAESVPSSEEIGEIAEEKIEPVKEDVDYLFGVVSQAGTPPELAVKLVPSNTLYLGTNILDISDVTYDPTYWDIENGMPKYLGGGSQSTTFKFNALTTAQARYLCDIITHTQDSKYESLFYLKIGNGNLVDTYNGTDTTFGGFVADGGSLEIVPYGTKAFSVTSITLKPIVNSSSEPGYTESRVLYTNNVNVGNSASTLIDGKWNVAVGPTGNCMANNVNGSRSVAIGMSALKDWNGGMQNIGIGTFALSRLKNGDHNIAIGSDCLWQAAKANDNVVIGKSACARMFVIDGVYQDDYELINNVVVGCDAMGYNQKTSSNSVAIGYKSNYYGVPNSVFIGSNCKTSFANSNIENVIAIGYQATATKSNQCVIGNSNMTEFVLGNKKLIFNNDNTVSWETIS